VSTELTLLLLAVRLVVVLAGIAVQARGYLGTNANTLASLDGCNFGANLDGGSDDFCSTT
jgi:hypothetical protein